MLTQVTALEQQKLEAQGKSTKVKIFALAPGVVDTEMQTEIRQVEQHNFSTLNKFINLKKEGQLDDAVLTAEKFFYLINHNRRFKETLQDVRQL